ncbi:MAG: hypothetical protein MKZ95_14450 [Pirellulales bacterium]|nr:hypothetical protein [Candidatus Neomarinimicrobiota bacterium]MCH2596977.1 hypothetical protein [Pirellulales bacterium]
MLRIRSDLPLRGDSSSRFVFGLVAILVFIAASAVTVNYYIEALVDEWNQNVTGTLTIQIPTDYTGSADTNDIQLLLDALSTHKAVLAANVVSMENMSKLLEPWLGQSTIITDLPLPILIDVNIESNDEYSVKSIIEVTKQVAPRAIVEDHRIWLNSIVNLADGLSIISLAIMLLVTGALSLIVIFATRASLTEYTQAIDILHIIGAKDGYVAGQFARRALVQGILGGSMGLILYGPMFVAITWLASQVQMGVLPDVALPIQHWILILLLPVIAGALAMLAAHITVRRILALKV